MMRPTTTLAASLAVATLLLGACGDDGDDTADAPTEEAGESGGSADGPVTIDIVDFEYDPPAITVAAGTEVTFVNQDTAAHTATARDGSFNTENLDGGAETTLVVDGSGEITYFCSYHPFMEATITVE